MLVGFLRSLTFIQNNCVVFPEAMIAFWDGGTAEERRAILPDYKMPFRAKELSEEEKEFERIFYEQADALVDMLPDFGVRSVKLPGVEADDLISFAAEELVERGNHVVIFSGDRDFYQLISENIKVFDANKGMLDEERVCRDWKITPPLYENFLRIRAIAGDKADSVRGAHGIGPVKAAMLLPYWDYIWNDDPVLTNAKVMKVIQTAREQRDEIEKAVKCIQLPTRLFSDEKEYFIREALRNYLFEIKPVQDHDAIANHLRNWEIVSL